jgi:hypothetical protein
LTPQLIEIQRFRSGWQFRGAEAGHTPFFTGLSAVEHAIDYAWESIKDRFGEIRLLARNGEVIMAVPFGEKRPRHGRKLQKAL